MQWIPKMKYRDDICKLTNCVNLKVCLGLCGFLKDVINGNNKGKEVLLSNLKNAQFLEYRNYNETLAARSENEIKKAKKRENKLKKILAEPNTAQKLFDLLIYAGFTITEISKYTNLSRSTIYRSIKKR